MKTYWGTGGTAPSILDLGTIYMEVSGQLDAPASLPPGRNPPRHFGMEGWVGHRAGLDAVMERKIPSSTGNQTPIFRSSRP